MTPRKTTEQFIKESRKAHGDKYDYSITNYINWETKVEYICPFHGAQSQLAQHHREGRGCNQCGRERTKKAFTYDTEKFIELANKKHKNRYSYPNSVYTNYYTKVRINCQLHGEFIQSAGLHLSGKGCQKCGLWKKSSGSLLKPASDEEFIRLSKEVHGDEYDYSLVKYINWYSSVTIVCLSHGAFKCAPTSHLEGTGCATCQNFEAFVQKARSLHGDKFQYDK